MEPIMANNPPPTVVERLFDAPRELVFQAWTTADHLKRWFSPISYTAPEAEIDFRPGGVFNLCMRSPGGDESWSRGHFVEMTPPERLVFAVGVDVAGDKKFNAHTTVTFTPEGAGTRMKVVQAYEIFDPVFMAAVNGAPEGWRTTLDKLEHEVARIRAAAEGRSVVHAIFSLERTYDATPAQVYHALTNQAAKAKWFEGGADWTPIERSMDCRPGGRERARGRWPTGMVTTFDAVYFDVIPDQRLVYAYDLWVDERKLSVSLATMEIKPVGAKTKLVATEQGAFLDGYDDAGAREHGTGLLLDRLGASLKA
jgi:uncharacterized protein YndB with AHSA1/START domain